MTILQAMQSAAIRLVGYRPSVFFSSQQKFEQEIVDLINVVATDICKYHDWQALTKINTMTGDGVTEEFDLPSDYDRQLLYSEVQDNTNWLWGYTHVSDINTFISQRYLSFATNPGIWIIYGNKMNFLPAPQSGSQAVYPYVSLNYGVNSGSQAIPSFSSDDDNFVIRGGEQLLTLGLIWRWRENKKLDATGDYESFKLALEQLAARDKGSNVFRQYSVPRLGNVSVAYPFPLG